MGMRARFAQDDPANTRAVVALLDAIPGLSRTASLCITADADRVEHAERAAEAEARAPKSPG